MRAFFLLLTLIVSSVFVFADGILNEDSVGGDDDVLMETPCNMFFKERAREKIGHMMWRRGQTGDVDKSEVEYSFFITPDVRYEVAFKQGARRRILAPIFEKNIVVCTRSKTVSTVDVFSEQWNHYSYPYVLRHLTMETGERACFFDRETGAFYISEPVEAFSEFSLAEHLTLLHNANGVVFFRPTDSSCVLPDELLTKLKKLTETDEYKRYERYAFDREKVSDAWLWFFSQKGGAFSEKTRGLPVDFSHGVYLLTRSGFDIGPTDLKKTASEFSELLNEIRSWYYNDLNPETRSHRYWRERIDIAKGIAISDNNLLSVSGRFTESHHYLGEILKRENLNTLDSVRVFNSDAISDGGTVYFILRYSDLSNSRKFKDILLSLTLPHENERDKREKLHVDYFGVIGEFDFNEEFPRAPAYRFDKEKKILYYSEPLSLSEVL